MATRCQNKKCREPLSSYSRALLCPSCRFLARWMFGLGAFVVGMAWALYRLLS
jgi:hypothetical protein